MRKCLSLMLYIVIIVSITNAQAPVYNWGKKAGGIKLDYAHGISVSGSGDVYITGEFNSTALFSGSVSLTSYGNVDFFLTKYNNNGEVIWAKNGGGTLTDRGFAITTYNEYIYVTGEYYGEAKFDTVTLTSSGSVDAFIAKYDTTGKLIWIRDGKNPAKTSGHAITTDQNGNVIAAGFFGNKDNLTGNFHDKQIITHGDRDIFLIKYNPEGEVIWVKAIGGIYAAEEPDALDCDSEGNIYLGGTVNDFAFFENTVVRTDSEDVFLAKYSPEGDLVWVKTAGGPGLDRIKSISLDENNNIYCTGIFDSSATFDSTDIVGNDNADVFIAKYNSSGNLLWIEQASSAKTDWGMGIAANNDGCVITGRFAGTITFGIVDVANLNGSDDIFVAKYDNSGNFGWVKQFGGVDNDYGRAISMDQAGNIYVAGHFKTAGTFDGNNLSSGGVEDIFIVKLGNNPVPVELAAFNYSISDNAVRLEWTSVTETNNSIYEVERSINNLSFVKIGTVQGFGTTSEKHLYSFIDENIISGEYYYRLKQIDYDGTFSYSKVLKINSNTPQQFALDQNYPNPFNPETVIQFKLPSDAVVSLKIFNFIGQEIAAPISEQSFSQGIYNIKFNAEYMSSGMYLYTLKAKSLDGQEFTSSKKMMVIK